MNWFKNLIGGGSGPERVDYYAEAMELLRSGNLHEALTSLRLALKETPGNALVLQQIAIVYTRIGMVDEAAKTYQHVLQRNPREPGAHYGLAFLLLRAGAEEAAARHLRAYLDTVPPGPEAAHTEHARQTLAELEAGPQEDGEAVRDTA